MIDEFKLQFPQFASLADESIQFWVDLVNEDVCGCSLKSDYLRYLMLAHFLICAQRAGFFGGSPLPESQNSGDVASKTVGPISISYGQAYQQASTYSTGGNLNSTEYGRLFMQLAFKKTPVVFVV
jgi:hypothetical protein